MLKVIKPKQTSFKSTTRQYCLANFVPKYFPASDEDIYNLFDFVKHHKKLLILTGAGVSTESGIPDYRSEVVGLYARSNHKPIQYNVFLKDSEARKRYWARNYVGWDRFSKCQPNINHFCVRELEMELNKVSAVVTQNVDNLHFKAGSTMVIELHGTAFCVICLSCANRFSREEVQKHMAYLNPSMTDVSTMIRPDGDVEIPEQSINNFIPPFCRSCEKRRRSGILKPDIVFFGDNVPQVRAKVVREELTSHTDAVLVLGSSLTVFSSYRIILQAIEENKPTAIVNIGPTRADHSAAIKISAKCGEVLPKLLQLLYNQKM